MTNGGLAGYRVTSTPLTNTERAVFRVDVDIPDVTLAPGRYWLHWGLTGSLSSGPWQPPTADGALGNAVQRVSAAAFALLVDSGDQLDFEFPLAIQGAVVPEPGTWAMILAGVAALASLARGARSDPREWSHTRPPMPCRGRHLEFGPVTAR
jgi:hypothetical protein